MKGKIMRILFFSVTCAMCLCLASGCSRRQLLRQVQAILHIHPANINDTIPESQTEAEIVKDIVEDTFDIAQDIIVDTMEDVFEL